MFLLFSSFVCLLILTTPFLPHSKKKKKKNAKTAWSWGGGGNRFVFLLQRSAGRGERKLTELTYFSPFLGAETSLAVRNSFTSIRNWKCQWKEGGLLVWLWSLPQRLSWPPGFGSPTKGHCGTSSKHKFGLIWMYLGIPRVIFSITFGF